MAARCVFQNRMRTDVRLMAWYTAFAMALALVLFANGADTANAAPEQRISLAKMTGEWRGSGWGVRHATAPRERVRCRMRAKYRAKSRKLILSGKCAATSRSFTILGHLAEYPGNKRITGRWINPSGIGSLNIRGVRRANAFIFTFRAKDRKSKKRRSYQTVWDMAPRSMKMRTMLVDHEKKPVGVIQFER